MKRDLDLVRAILITAENSDKPIGDDVLLSMIARRYDEERLYETSALLCGTPPLCADGGGALYFALAFPKWHRIPVVARSTRCISAGKWACVT